jgi:DNA-binding NarL/FixJ family response regulator
MIIIIDDSDCEALLRAVVKLITPHGIKISDTELPHKQETAGQGGNIKNSAIQLLNSGISTEEVAKATGLKESTVRAYKAHLTMGTYK